MQSSFYGLNENCDFVWMSGLFHYYWSRLIYLTGSGVGTVRKLWIRIPVPFWIRHMCDGKYGKGCNIFYLSVHIRDAVSSLEDIYPTGVWPFCKLNCLRLKFFLIIRRARVCLPLLCLWRRFSILRDVWIWTQRAAVASRRATNLTTHLPN